MFELNKLKLRKFVFVNFFVVGILLFSQSISASTINGTVFDNRRNALTEVDVELQDEFYRQIDRTRTDGAGRYQFNNLSDGDYVVKVMPFRYDLEDQTQRVEIRTVSIRGAGSGNTYETRDFYLVPKKGSLADYEVGVVFAQEVPKEAERIYKQAVKDISKGRKEEGMSGLKEALKVFPNYYLALQDLGKELYLKGDYETAAPVLLKAVGLYDKNPLVLYYLGVSLQNLNYSKPAITALKQANILAPTSIQVLLSLGKAERIDGQFADAEKHLLQAKKLSKVDIPDIHWELAWLYGENLKKYKEAIEELEQYLKAGNFNDDYVKKVKKLISNLEEKIKTQNNS